MKMEAIKKIAAVGVLLYGVSVAQSPTEFSSGKFTFQVEEKLEISCTDAAAVEASVAAITSSQDASGSTAKIECEIAVNAPAWDITVTAQNGGYIVDQLAGNLQIDDADAYLAIYATLEAAAGYPAVLFGTSSTPYDDADAITGGVAKTIDDGTLNAQFSLAELFGTELSLTGNSFIGKGETNAKLTVKGAPQSQTGNKNITSGVGDYIETLTFEVGSLI